MSLFSLLLLCVALSTDAFAAAISRGVVWGVLPWPKIIGFGLLFGTIEALMPIIGWLLGTVALSYIEAWDHWLAFAVLVTLGLMAIYQTIYGDDDPIPDSTMGWSICLTAFATSIDSMAVGVSLAMLEVNIFQAALMIAITTTLMVMLGLRVGQRLGQLIGKRASLIGGMLLILMGCMVLYQHLTMATIEHVSRL